MRPLPWSATQRPDVSAANLDGTVTLWHIADAQGAHVATVVGSPDDDPSGAPAPILEVAYALAERRERDRNSLAFTSDEPVVIVNVPGVGARAFGASARPGEVPRDDGGALSRPEPTARRDLAITRAMLADAWRVVDEDYRRLTSARPHAPSTEAVALAARHLDGELARLRTTREPVLTDQALAAIRTLVRAVSPP